MPRSARGEFELPEAVRLAVSRGVPFRVVRARGAVLDLSRQSDIASVSARLAGREAEAMSAEHFVSLGMTAEDATGRAALVDRVRRGFTGLVGAPPAWCWFVPGRIEVLGKHTDYAGGDRCWPRCRAASPSPPVRGTTAACG